MPKHSYNPTQVSISTHRLGCRDTLSVRNVGQDGWFESSRGTRKEFDGGLTNKLESDRIMGFPLSQYQSHGFLHAVFAKGQSVLWKTAADDHGARGGHLVSSAASRAGSAVTRLKGGRQSGWKTGRYPSRAPYVRRLKKLPGASALTQLSFMCSVKLLWRDVHAVCSYIL